MSATPTIPVSDEDVAMIRERVIGFLFDIPFDQALGTDPELFEATRALLNNWASVQARLSDGLLLIEPFVLDAVRGVVASAIVEKRMKSTSDYNAECAGDELELWAPLLERIEMARGSVTA
ncbi:MAG TPA: hypothetical protein VHM72_06320 [Solirubrobacteraceae bacterium]|jgi:hypothetical protein|nr:hypothetical protein [Solirubrobacteraceae bacterium]